MGSEIIEGGERGTYIALTMHKMDLLSSIYLSNLHSTYYSTSYCTLYYMLHSSSVSVYYAFCSSTYVSIMSCIANVLIFSLVGLMILLSCSCMESSNLTQEELLV